MQLNTAVVVRGRFYNESSMRRVRLYEVSIALKYYSKIHAHALTGEIGQEFILAVTQQQEVRYWCVRHFVGTGGHCPRPHPRGDRRPLVFSCWKFITTANNLPFPADSHATPLQQDMRNLTLRLTNALRADDHKQSSIYNVWDGNRPVEKTHTYMMLVLPSQNLQSATIFFRKKQLV
jgi:hypothetical protein